MIKASSGSLEAPPIRVVSNLARTPAWQSAQTSDHREEAPLLRNTFEQVGSTVLEHEA